MAKYIDKDETLKMMKMYASGSIGFAHKHYSEMMQIVEGMEEVDAGAILMEQTK